MSSAMKTAAHAPMATLKRLPVLNAIMTAATKPAMPDIIEEVAVIMAGKVITDRVT